MTETNKKKPGTSKVNNWPRTVGLTLLGLAAVGVFCLMALFIYAARDLPSFDPGQLSGAKTTLIYDDQDQLVSGLHAGQNRTEVSLDKVPENLINAFVATEDRNFYRHHGVNFRGIARAIYRNLTSGDLKGEGASSITQQLARNAYLSLETTWERKAKEILIALKLETVYSKDEIMNMYLNIIPFGNGAYGVQAAANTYFGKDVDQLDLAECSLLAGLPQGPSYYDPYQHLDRAKARQRDVLNNMVWAGYIDQQTADAAFAVPLNLTSGRSSNKQYGYYVDAVIEEAIDVLRAKKIYPDLDEAEGAIYRAGFKIYTAMDADLQKFAEEQYANPDRFLKQISPSGQAVQSAMAIVEAKNGEVKSIMGGRNYQAQRQFNRAISAYRQPGSAIKPLTVYGPALEAGLMPFMALDDSPIAYKAGGTVWAPKNYDGKFRGIINMREGVKDSVNTYAVQTLDKVGIRASFDFGRSLGLPLLDSPGNNDLALAPLALGGLTKGVTPVQMAAAYAAYANSGVYNAPHFIRRIVDANGTDIYIYQPHSQRVMTEQTAWLMTSMLRTVVTSGTGTRAQVPGVFTVGKTGTTEEYRDSWFCGFTPTYAAAVWMGFDQKDTLRNNPSEYPGETAYGGNVPARLFSSLLTKAHRNSKPGAPSQPGNIVEVSVCKISGKIPSDICSTEQIITEYCLASAVPTETCESHHLVTICPESGKLAGINCPHPETRVMVATDEKSVTTDKIPTETCDIHDEFTFSSLLRHEVVICTDPRHNGRLYAANLPGKSETGGCPEQYLQRVMVQEGQHLEHCPLADHQESKKKARDVVKDAINGRD
ncbi:MAG: transglycosylase domain-containing protein [Syntrophomonadaceae bacterium]|jgi:penicillin-binding protein 1A